jgi:AraC family transcriptional regulator, ethanolamine operon transcriptional activator
MPTHIEALEVDDFTAAVAGLETDYVRTGKGDGPCRMTNAGTDVAQLSTGSMGFSAISQTDVPDDLVVFSLITAAPPGSVWCGVEITVGQVNVYGPGTSFVGVNPVGLGATFLAVHTGAIERAAADLGVSPVVPSSVQPLGSRPSVERFRRAMWQASVHPEVFDHARPMSELLAAAVDVLADTDSTSAVERRRLDSRKIVVACVDFVETTGRHQPSMTELRRAACASESRVRQAFVEILDAPPTQYFQYRLLSRLRDELLLADPERDTVTRIASSLGVTQLGRIAGRYRRLFDELPSDTLRR